MIKITREWAMPNKWTFQIKPIKELLDKYVKDGRGWIDPFAGMNSPAEIKNDYNSQMKAEYHLEAEEFGKTIKGKFKGVLFDPPYSYRQVTEHYTNNGKKATQEDTSTRFYNRAMNPISNKIMPGGYAISFGWNSNGFGKGRGFKIIEILLVAHGGHHNDTIITVEKKINNEVGDFLSPTGESLIPINQNQKTIG